jgi:hypothetical protein
MRLIFIGDKLCGGRGIKASRLAADAAPGVGKSLVEQLV